MRSNEPDGLGGCVACGRRLPPSEMDIVGLGYRCSACTNHAHVESLAQGTNDLAHNLSGTERRALASESGKVIPTSIVIALLGAILVPVWPIETGPYWGVPYAMIAVGVASAIGAFATLRYARGRGHG